MPNHHPQHLTERLLQAVVDKSVSEKLGTLFRELGEFTKGMTAADANGARLMVLEMVRNSCGEFHAKMTARIYRQEAHQPE